MGDQLAARAIHRLSRSRCVFGSFSCRDRDSGGASPWRADSRDISGQAHDVRNALLAPAISIHAYSPPLSDMNEFELYGSRLVPRDRASGETETVDQEWRVQKQQPLDRTDALSIEQVLSAARARLRRLSPDEADGQNSGDTRRYSSREPARD
jgi:hypothetical protein